MISGTIKAYRTTTAAIRAGLTLAMLAVLLLSPVAAFAQVGPDLTVDSVTPQGGVHKRGMTIPVTVCTSNGGTTDAGAFKVGVYFSTNDYISTSDRRLATISYTSLAHGAVSDCRKAYVVLPGDMPGEGWIGGLADYEYKVPEGDESNNAKAVKLNIPTADLVVSSVTVPAGPHARGGTISVQVCTTNQGTEAATAFKVGVYFSTDNVISKSDTKVGEISYTGLAMGGAPDCKSVNVLVSSGLTTGWLGALADHEGKVIEQSETNNTKAAKLEVLTPDLAAVSIAVTPTAYAPGDTVNATVCVKNNGNLDATAFKVAFYHSTDGTISSGDTKLVEVSVTGLAKGGTQTCRRNCLNESAKAFPHELADRLWALCLPVLAATDWTRDCRCPGLGYRCDQGRHVSDPRRQHAPRSWR